MPLPAGGIAPPPNEKDVALVLERTQQEALSALGETDETSALLLRHIINHNLALAAKRPDLAAKALIYYRDYDLQPALNHVLFVDWRGQGKAEDIALVFTQDAYFYIANRNAMLGYELHIEPIPELVQVPVSHDPAEGTKPAWLLRGLINVIERGTGMLVRRIEHGLIYDETRKTRDVDKVEVVEVNGRKIQKTTKQKVGNFLWRDSEEGGAPMAQFAKVLRVQLLRMAFNIDLPSDIEHQLRTDSQPTVIRGETPAKDAYEMLARLCAPHEGLAEEVTTALMRAPQADRQATIDRMTAMLDAEESPSREDILALFD